ncbi:MAG: oligosaccharide flippase family protein [candidate division WOR-3 bacterium]|nr:MAG: oligosaccharide flippase family protein [candidate division WOR-3 bacterium]
MSKGVIYSLISRLIFVLGGYVMHICLARLLGPARYGTFGICIAIITICYVVLGNGVRQSVSNSVSKKPGSAKYFLQKALVVQVCISLVLGFMLVLFTKYLAAVFNDPQLVMPLYIVAVVIVVQSLFFVNMGVLNGLKKFRAENVLMGGYGIAKALAAVLLVYMGMGVIGGLLGFLLGAVFAFVLGTILTRDVPGSEYTNVRINSLLRHALPIMVMFGAMTVIMNADLLAVKLFITDGRFAGYYTSAATISRLIYWYFAAFGIVLLPFVSSTFTSGESKQMVKYIDDVVRYSLLMILPVILLISIYSHDIIGLVYGSEYRDAGMILAVLIWGLMLLGIAYVFSSIMIGMEGERTMVLYSLLGIAAAVITNTILVPVIGPIGGAISTMISAAVIVILPFFYVRRRHGLSVEVGSIAKVGIALTAVLLVAIVTISIPVSFVVKFIALYTLYVVVLYATREVRQPDFEILANLFRQRVHIERG